MLFFLKATTFISASNIGLAFKYKTQCLCPELELDILELKKIYSATANEFILYVIDLLSSLPLS